MFFTHNMTAVIWDTEMAAVIWDTVSLTHDGAIFVFMFNMLLCTNYLPTINVNTEDNTTDTYTTPFQLVKFGGPNAKLLVESNQNSSESVTFNDASTSCTNRG